MRFIVVFGWLIILVNIAILAMAYFYFMNFEPPKTRFPVRGIDVSHRQGDIDWRAVKRSGIAFAFMKATEGGDFKDPKFKANWREAGAAGLLRGAYHFFTFCRPGADQARNYIDSVPADPSSLPPVVDLELEGNCKKNPAKADLKKELGVFLQRVETHYRQKPILYMSKEFHDAYYGKLGFKNPLWLRSLFSEPSYAKEDWLFWQYHDRGRRDGVDGPVDLNVYRFDRGRLQSLSGPRGGSSQGG